MNRRTHPIVRCLGAGLAGVLVVASALVVAPANAKVPRAPHRYSAAIEGLAGYSPQSKCSAWAKPGTTAFANMLLRTYRNSRSLGIVRSCGVGGTSEHKEGRAFDWGVSAYNAKDRRSVRALMRWLLKKDQHGNRYAMARRLGIQYMIWNRRIWGSYSASSGWRRYTGASPHTDHVHFSLSWKGARKKTSFWQPKRFGKPAPRPPKPEPRKPRRAPKKRAPNKPAPKRPAPGKQAPKPLPEPKPLRVVKNGPDLVEEQLRLPARRRWGVTTRGELQEGHDYRIEVSGRYRYAKKRNAFADAECSSARRSRWRRDRSLRRRDRDADHLDVYVDGQDLYAWAANGEDCDTGGHSYAWEFEADRDGRVPLRIWDPVNHGDNTGALKVEITDLDARWEQPGAETPEPSEPEPTEPERIVTETLRVRSWAADAVRTQQSYPAGTVLLVTVRGRYSLRGWLDADAECVDFGSRGGWGNHLGGDADLTVNGATDRWWPADGSGDCDDDHRYTREWTVDDAGPLYFRVNDNDPGRNEGRLTVTVEAR